MKRGCKTIVYPRRIVADSKTENAESLLKEKTLQIGLSEKEVAAVEAGGYTLLDFGRELAGGVRLLVYGAEQGASLRLRLGESAAECCAEIGEKNCGNAHAYRDLTIPAAALSDSSFFDSGFRFLRIDALGGRVTIKNAVAEAWESEVDVAGSFECSDSRLNEIYAAAARTVELCVRRGVLWDGVKRDRLVWIGDLYPEFLALAELTADYTPVVRSLDFAREQTPPTEWISGIPMYSMWWVIILDEYYRRTGDVEYVCKQREYVEKLSETIEKYIGEDGSTRFETNLVDWPTHETKDEAAGVHAVSLLFVSAAERVLDAAGGNSLPCVNIAERLKRKSFEVEAKKQIIALKDFAGEPVSEAEKEKLLAGGAKGMSTFMSYFLLCATEKAAGTARALETAKEYYGKMLDLGATTFWEDFDLDWAEGAVCPIDRLPETGEKDIHGDCGAYCYLGYRHSLCHGWSSGVLPYLAERVLGVSVEENGEKVVVAPSLGGLAWAKGDVPLRKGILHLEIVGKKIKIRAPYGVRVVCRPVRL